VIEVGGCIAVVECKHPRLSAIAVVDSE
jgi:hypothetical protein